jgi:DNA-binding transcriptional LysR family regulator
VSATEHGELLAHYARRLLALSREAEDALTSDVALEPVRIGVPGEVEIALVKREPGSGYCLASWPESLVWVKGEGVELTDEPVPLALFPPGCVYRQRAIRSLDKARRRWRVAFGSHSLTGIQAAVSSGLGVSVLPTTAVLPEHRVWSDLPDLPPTELALVSSGGVLNAVQQALIEFLRAAIKA